jgi:hypothetical protein
MGPHVSFENTLKDLCGKLDKLHEIRYIKILANLDLRNG